MIDRRKFVAGLAAAAPAGAAFAAAPHRGPQIIINTSGPLDNPNQKVKQGRNSYIPIPDQRTWDDARAAGMTAICITVGEVSGQADPFENTVDELAAADEVIRTYPAKLIKVLTGADIERAAATRRIGIIYGVQNCEMLGDKVERVDLFADLGLRFFQLTYNPENALGGGLNAEEVGLKPFGRQVIERLNARRAIVDLAHSGRRTCLDALAASKQPIAITHTGCRALRDVPRNKSDEELRGVAQAGGYVGIFTSGMFLAAGHEANALDVIAHIEHAVQVCGEDHVGIGTDNPITGYDNVDGFRKNWGEYVQSRRKAGVSASGEVDGIPFVPDLQGADQFHKIGRLMRARGHSAARVDKILGRNFLNYATAIWGA